MRADGLASPEGITAAAPAGDRSIPGHKALAALAQISPDAVAFLEHG